MRFPQEAVAAQLPQSAIDLRLCVCCACFQQLLWASRHPPTEMQLPHCGRKEFGTSSAQTFGSGMAQDPASSRILESRIHSERLWPSRLSALFTMPLVLERMKRRYL
mmetsp:Transcript_74497/g.117902  ORF Transcript_74497/g.117902 Transcript_74497/m.117902 type:complete len:107 (-) Transcript_74497:22-342(-)